MGILTSIRSLCYGLARLLGDYSAVKHGRVGKRAARRPLLGNVRGGLSGPAVKPVALYNVYRVAAAVAVPVVGCGGIASANDALEFIMSGAMAVQVGTATFVNPDAALAVVDGVAAYLRREGVGDVAELVGVARPRPAMVRR